MAAGGTDLVYNNARQKFATGAWNWNTLPVAAALVSAAYSPSVNDVLMSAIPEAALLISGNVLTNQTVALNGAVQGIIPTYLGLNLASDVAAIVLYNTATNELIYYSSSGVGFPFAAQGENFNIGYDQFNGGFFQV